MKTKEMTSNPVYPYRTWYNYKLTEEDQEKNSGDLITIPDQAYTIKEILEKFTNGVLPDLTKLSGYPDEEPTFDDTDPIRDPAFDLADATVLLQEIAQKLETKTEVTPSEPQPNEAPAE